MFTPIQQFLERVAVPGSPRRIRREAARILSQATGIALSAEQVEYRDGVVRITARARRTTAQKKHPSFLTARGTSLHCGPAMSFVAGARSPYLEGDLGGCLVENAIIRGDRERIMLACRPYVGGNE